MKFSVEGKEKVVEVRLRIVGEDINLEVSSKGVWKLLFWIEKDGSLNIVHEEDLPEGFSLS